MMRHTSHFDQRRQKLHTQRRDEQFREQSFSPARRERLRRNAESFQMVRLVASISSRGQGLQPEGGNCRVEGDRIGPRFAKTSD
jgi:hypothetical protein